MAKDSWYEKNKSKAEEIEPMARSICQDYPVNRPLTRQEQKVLSNQRVAVVETIYHYLKDRPIRYRIGEVYGDYAMEIWETLEDGLKPGKQWKGLFFLNFLMLLEKRIGGGIHTSDNAGMKRFRVKEALDAVAQRHGFGKSEARKMRESFFDRDTILYRVSLERYLREKISCSEVEVRHFFSDFFDIEYVTSQHAEYEDSNRVAAMDKAEEKAFFYGETRIENDYYDIVQTVKRAFAMAKNDHAKTDLRCYLTLQIIDSAKINRTGKISRNIHDVLEKMNEMDGIPDELSPYIDRDYMMQDHGEEDDGKDHMEKMAVYLGIQPVTWRKRYQAAKKFMMKVAAEWHSREL